VNKIQSVVAKNQMILPDDRNAAIRWDEATQKWIGQGVDDGTVVEKPPVTAQSLPASASGSVTSAGLTAARKSGGTFVCVCVCVYSHFHYTFRFTLFQSICTCIDK
jgi:hypothetical protein